MYLMLRYEILEIYLSNIIIIILYINLLNVFMYKLYIILRKIRKIFNILSFSSNLCLLN